MVRPSNDGSEHRIEGLVALPARPVAPAKVKSAVAGPSEGRGDDDALAAGLADPGAVLGETSRAAEGVEGAALGAPPQLTTNMPVTRPRPTSRHHFGADRIVARGIVDLLRGGRNRGGCREG